MGTAMHKGMQSPRLNVRMPEEARAMIAQAAALEGRTTSDFVLASAMEKARETIAAHQRIVLSQRDSAIFIEAMLNPPEPSDKLRAAIADYLAFTGERARGE